VQNVATDKQNAVAARATLASSAAQVAKAKTAAALAALTVQRDAVLLTHGYVAQNQYDTDASARVAAQAALTAAQLAVDQARAQAAAKMRSSPPARRKRAARVRRPAPIKPRSASTGHKSR